MSEETKAPENETKAPEIESPPADGEKTVILTVEKYDELSNLVGSLSNSLAAKDTELSEAKKTIEAQAGDIASLKAAGDDAVRAYKKLAISSNPLFTEDVIAGSTIAEVDVSVNRFLDLAGKVRTRLEAEIRAITVPAGAPERSGPDTSGLSPREKIKQGIEATNK